MDKKEFNEALEGLATKLEGKTKKEAGLAIKAFQEDFEKKQADAKVEATKAQKAVIELAIKEATEAIEKKHAEAIKVVQDHADKLDMKLQKGEKGVAATKSFEQVLGETLLEKTDDIAKFERKETKSLVLELKAVGDMSTGNVTGGNRYGQLMNPNIIDRPSRKVHMDTIIPGGSIGPGNSFTFMREVGQGEGGPAPVAEGALKPQMDLDLEESTVQIETTAAWLRITRKAMTNIPGMVSFLQRRMPEKFRRVMDSQILYGDGATPNHKGMLTAGNFQASAANIALPLIEKIITDISTLEDTFEREADSILLRPADYYSFFLNKAAGSGEYDLPQGVTIVNGQLMFMGIPAYATTALTSRGAGDNDYAVADLANGVQLLTQESMRLEFFEQDGDNVRTNKVTVRIEGNHALPVYGDDYIIKGTTAQA